MTEHERSVNDLDIKAYQKGDNQNLYSMMHGLSGDCMFVIYSLIYLFYFDT
jgi:hypothetical protein